MFQPSIGRLLLVGTLFLSVLFPVSIYACSPALPEPWFREQITTLPATLPSGVQVQAIEVTQYARTRAYVEITNRSATPLYVIGTLGTARPASAQLPSPALPPGMGATHQIVNLHALTWGPLGDTPPSAARMGWTEGTAERQDAVLLSIHHNTLRSDEAIVLELVPNNRTGDHRPTDVRLPDPQAIAVPLVYGTELITVPLTVSYILNPNYHPQSVAQSRGGCPGASPISLVWIGVIGVLIGGGIGVSWLKQRQAMRQP